MFRSLFVFVVLIALSISVQAQKSVLGVWKVVDPSSNDILNHVQIFEFQGKVYGRVVKNVKLPADHRCAICPGELKNQLVLGMMVLEKLQFREGFYQSGKLLDVQSGKWYSCQMWLKNEDPDVLVIRNFLGFLYRTQYWYRVQ